jgi:hypothetical protein
MFGAGSNHVSHHPGGPRRLLTLRGNPLLKPPGLSFGIVGPCKSWDSFGGSPFGCGPRRTDVLVLLSEGEMALEISEERENAQRI